MIEEILNRRSIRTFQTTPVSSEIVEQVLQAGILAPSSKNRQPWRFVVEICNIQSAGAAIENMTLEACRLGLGSLWICDTFFAYPELCRWLKTDGVLIAALALGHAGESPAARPRTPLRNITEWRE